MEILPLYYINYVNTDILPSERWQVTGHLKQLNLWPVRISVPTFFWSQPRLHSVYSVHSVHSVHSQNVHQEARISRRSSHQFCNTFLTFFKIFRWYTRTRSAHMKKIHLDFTETAMMSFMYEKIRLWLREKKLVPENQLLWRIFLCGDLCNVFSTLKHAVFF